ncbi:MAG: VOC family protein [Spirochaetia bacterium]|jgi:glyoxylase I family protein
MPPLSFSHVSLNCNDPLAVERYYSRHFGFTRARVIPLGQQQIVFIKSGSMYIEIFNATENRPVPAAGKDGPGYPGVRHIAFKVDSVDAKLREMGKDARITLGPLDFDDFIPGWRTVWVADPEGNVVEISQGYLDQPNPPQLDFAR